MDAAKLHWIFTVPVGITISFVGFFGNLLSMIVWFRVLRKNYVGNKSTALYLFTLAIADSFLLASFAITNALPEQNPTVLQLQAFCTFYSYFGFPFLYYFVVLSIWLVVAVTVSRFIMVLFPLKAKELCSNKRAFIGIAIILVCSFIINIPHFFNFRPEKINGKYKIEPTKYSKTGSSKHYEFWVHCMFLVLGPWFTIAFCNCSIIYALVKRKTKSSKKFHKAIENNGPRESQMTFMLLSVSFSFLVLLIWQCITQCFFMLGYGKKSGEWDTVNKSFAVAKLGVVINSSINFILYCLTGKTFRRELLGIFLKRKVSLKAPLQSERKWIGTLSTLKF